MKTKVMNKKKFYDTLRSVCTLEGVPASECSAAIYKEIEKAGIIRKIKHTQKRGFVYVSNFPFEELKEKIEVEFKMDLEKFVLLSDCPTREEVSDAMGSSKEVTTEVDNGFSINVFPIPVEYVFDGTRSAVSYTLGLSPKINDWRKFFLDKDVKIVIVENYSTFYNIQKYTKLWSNGEKYFFVLRNEKQNNIIAWLNKNQPDNEIYHFGDWDVFGLQIYQGIKKHIEKKGRFHFFKLPLEEMEWMIKQSNSSLFYKQYKYEYIDSSDNEISDVLGLIKKYGKTLEQEALPGKLEEYEGYKMHKSI